MRGVSVALFVLLAVILEDVHGFRPDFEFNKGGRREITRPVRRRTNRKSAPWSERGLGGKSVSMNLQTSSNLSASSKDGGKAEAFAINEAFGGLEMAKNGKQRGKVKEKAEVVSDTGSRIEGKGDADATGDVGADVNVKNLKEKNRKVLEKKQVQTKTVKQDKTKPQKNDDAKTKKHDKTDTKKQAAPKTKKIEKKNMGTKEIKGNKNPVSMNMLTSTDIVTGSKKGEKVDATSTNDAVANVKFVPAKKGKKPKTGLTVNELTQALAKSRPSGDGKTVVTAKTDTNVDVKMTGLKLKNPRQIKKKTEENGKKKEMKEKKTQSLRGRHRLSKKERENRSGKRQKKVKVKHPRHGKMSKDWKKKNSRRRKQKAGQGQEQCQDIEVYSMNNEYYSERVSGCSVIKSVTLNWAVKECDCELGQTFGFDRNRIFVDYGCGGSFRVCCRAERRRQIMRKSLRCRRPFYEEDGRCIVTEQSNCMEYVEAAQKCADIGGKLLQVDDLVTKAGQLKRENRLKRGRYFIGGAKAFSQMNFEMSLSAQSIFTTAGPGSSSSISHQLDMNFAFNMAEMFKMAGINMRAFRRFGTKPSVDTLNMDSPLNSQCLAYDVGDDIQPTMADCDQKANFICEQMPIDREDDGCKWSPWINSDTNADGDENENLCDIIDAVGKGEIKDVKPGELCEKPLAMECRDAKTKKMFGPKSRNGLDLIKACVKNSFRCRDFDQTCPDVEVRFKCPDTPLKDCAVDRVRKFCERKGQRCEMTPVGAKCVKVPERRSGKEIIGKATCKVNSKVYNVSTCVARGDPHYHTLDGLKYDFQGGCSYVMATTCNNYVYNEEFPTFTITSVNELMEEDNNFSTTKGFVLSLNGIKYTFTRGKFYVNKGGVNMERNFVDYSDNQITIQATPRDRGDFGLTIDTNFCMRIRWDNKYMLQIRVPEPYMKHICGLCGNYDDDLENDLVLPGSKDPVTPNEFGEYYIAGGTGMEKCVDVIGEPQTCPPKKMDKFTGPKYCGVLNPDGDSPFAKAVVEATKTECNVRRLREIYEECVFDHCWAEIPDNDRCHMLEANIQETLLELNIRDETLDALWREYADCGPKCVEKPNMEYKSSFMPNCQNTCLEPTKSTVCCDKEVVAGCVCKKGFVLDSKMNCVPLEECDLSCNIVTECGERVNIKNNETMVVTPCEKVIFCNNGEAQERPLDGCSEHGQCQKDGQTCKCLEGYRGDGKTCRPARPCRKNYVSMGTKCYRVVRDPLDWHTAAINCGADGASLARYDNVRDLEVEKYFDMIPELLLLQMSKTRKMECCSGATCNIASQQAALTVRVANESAAEACKGKFRITEDRKQLVVDEGCNSKFIVQTVDSKLLSESREVVTWVGGNSIVLKSDQRTGKTPFQVDPPRLLDAESSGEMNGCFQATRNSEDQFIISPNTNCEAKLPSICEYDNSLLNNYDPLDIVVIKELVTWDVAVARCKAMNRPVASLKNREQQTKAVSLLKGHGHSAFISAYYDVSIKAYRWEDGERLAYTDWVTAPEPYRNGHEHFCVTINPHSGVWYSRKCSNEFFVVCGPPDSDVPLVFTPYYPVPCDVSLEEIKGKIRRAQCQDYICDDPVTIECSAKAKNGDWVTQETQSAQTIRCTKDEIRCISGKELNCSTLKVRFLCPYEENQCKELATLNAPACQGGRECYPVQNHYICKCPAGMAYSERTRECNKVCGECTAWGDPHYTTFGGNKYDFMGPCTYKFTGVCNPEDYRTEPYFEVITTNKMCTGSRSDGTCIEWVEIKLTNIPVITPCGAKIQQNFTIKTKTHDKRYWINDVECTDEINARKDVWNIVNRHNEWIVTIFSLDLKIKLMGNHLRVQVPERFSGNLCGLCGDCGTDKFRLRNGTSIEVPKKDYRWNWNVMKILGDDWRVANKDSSQEKCLMNITQEECSTTEKLKLQDEKYCGVFVQPGNFLQECFDKMNENGTGLTMNIKRQEYHHNCIFDMCGSENPDEAICNILKTFSQECAYIGVTVQWRSPERCPMNCPQHEIYRIDASCQRQCNEEPGTQGACDEDPVEGCACKDGFRRRNNECVREEECGCRVLDFEGNLIKYLQPGEELILPKCTELARCETSELRYVDYALPNNAVCSNSVPPKYVCAKGFKFAEDNVTCIRARDSCTSPYDMIDGMCLNPPRELRNWRQAVYRCNQADGTLVHIDTVQKKDTIKRLLVDNKWTSVFVSGRVVAKNMFGLVMFTPLLEEKERGQMGWMNFHFYEGFVDKVYLSKEVDKNSIPEEGLVLSVAATLDHGEVVFKAVPSNYRSNILCEERPPPDNPAWTPPCNTDSNMEDDGDQETLFNMEMDDNCLVCPKPMDVKCETVEGSTGVDGKCQVTPDGVFYSCNQGKACADKTVSTQCHKDVDECAENRHDCPKNSKCINTIGAFRCKCDDAFPLMVKGECKEVTSCVVKGPETSDEYIHDLKPFSGTPSTFDLDCRYKIVSFCREATPEDIPRVLVYDTSYRSKDKYREEVFIAFNHPTSGRKVAVVTSGYLKNGTIQYDTFYDAEMDVRDVGFTDEAAGVEFKLFQGPKLVIRSTDNYYRVTITFPLKVQVDLPSEYKDKLCGVCTAEPPVGEQNIVFSDEKLAEITLDPSENNTLVYFPKPCKPRTPPRDLIVEVPTTKAPTTKAPTTKAPTTKAPTTKAPTTKPPTVENPPLPPPPPPSKGECEQSYKDFCQGLSSVCAVSRRACEMELCPGKTKTCDYLIKNAFVSCNTGAELKSFLNQQDCDSVCESHATFQYTRKSLVRTCSYPYGMCAQEDTVNDDYGFQCMCSAGFVLSGKTCLRPESCGCTMEDGSYKPPGYVWRSKDCSEVITCEGGGKVTRVASPCGANTWCDGSGGTMKCACNPGFFGNPQSEEGCTPGDDFPGKTCYEYVDQKTGLKIKDCVCKRGYVSDCNDCLDVDECGEGIHNCDLSSQKCVNSAGSYKCECLDGFVKDGLKCTADQTRKCPDAQASCKKTWDQDKVDQLCSASVAYRQCLDKILLENLCPNGPDYPQELADADASCINKEPEPDANNGQPGEPVFTSWTTFGECQYHQEDCGLGSQKRTRQIVPYSDKRKIRDVAPYELEESRVCFKKCPGMKAIDCPCSCVCDEKAPVCGALGPGKAKTYKSECEMILEACSTSYTAVKLYDGPCSKEDDASNRKMCSAGPRNKIMKYDQVKDGRRCVGEPVPIGTCENMLCEGTSCNCCRPVELERISVEVSCISSNTTEEVVKTKHVYMSAKKCGCASLIPQPVS